MGNYETQFFCVNSRFHATTCRGLAFKILHIYCCAEMKFPGRLHSSKVSKFCRQCIFQHLVKVLDPANLYHWWLWYMELFRDEMFCSVLITLFQHFFLFRSVPNDLKELLAAGNLQDTEKFFNKVTFHFLQRKPVLVSDIQKYVFWNQLIFWQEPSLVLVV